MTQFLYDHGLLFLIAGVVGFTVVVLFRNAFPRKTLHTLLIYMKSGNVVRVDRVADWKFVTRGDEIVEVEIRNLPEKRGYHRLAVKTLALSQIEAVTTVRTK